MPIKTRIKKKEIHFLAIHISCSSDNKDSKIHSKQSKQIKIWLIFTEFDVFIRYEMIKNPKLTISSPFPHIFLQTKQTKIDSVPLEKPEKASTAYWAARALPPASPRSPTSLEACHGTTTTTMTTSFQAPAWDSRISSSAPSNFPQTNENEIKRKTNSRETKLQRNPLKTTSFLILKILKTLEAKVWQGFNGVRETASTCRFESAGLNDWNDLCLISDCNHYIGVENGLVSSFDSGFCEHALADTYEFNGYICGPRLVCKWRRLLIWSDTWRKILG